MRMSLFPSRPTSHANERIILLVPAFLITHVLVALLAAITSQQVECTSGYGHLGYPVLMRSPS